MQQKFETQSTRVKGLAFHPTRHWILASLHNGCIQLWDYFMEALLDKYEEHDGPVRGIAFHPTQPLFASGGDDYKVKLWNFKQKKCIVTLDGHLDYIRTVCFHHELPWLMSCSDDQTIRIWNWQSRSCLAILTGHNHYIMCAQFHPKEDMIVSSSLDQTIRVWDFKNLRQKFYSAGGRSSEIIMGTDVVVKFVLEGHDRGVNWAIFHPNSPYIVSAADDRTVRLWRYTESKSWEVETMRGHSNNVSCALFHPNLEVIISDSEDKSLRIWDMNRRSTIHTYKRENDRFWVLAIHPTNNLVAAGFDSGFLIFKCEKERVPAVKTRGNIYIVAKKTLRKVDEQGRETVLATLKPPSKREVYKNNPSHIFVNQISSGDYHVLLQYQQEGGVYFLFSFNKDFSGDKSAVNITGASTSSCFIGKDRFVILTKQKEVQVMDFSNAVKKKLTFGFTPSAIYPAGINRILIKHDDSLSLFDISAKEIIKTVALSATIKQVIWTLTNEYAAILSSENITLISKNLDVLCTSPRERINIKSGVWDPCGVFVYSTATHLRYIIVNGDNGTVRSLDKPIYLVSIDDKEAVGVDREGDIVKLPTSNLEYRFKLALHCKRYNEVKLILESGGLIGNGVVKYLQDRGFSEIALYFVEDEKTRFNLAIQAGIIEIALQSAYKLNDKECWLKLGSEALRQGNSQIVEMAYQKTRNLDRLSVLYMITGNLNKLSKMQQIAETRGDKLRLFHNTLLRGDIEKRVEMLAEAGQVPLAYITARIHGIQHMLNGPLEQSLGEQGVQKLEDYISKLPQPKALYPPVPIFTSKQGGDENWPLHHVITSEFELLKNQVDPANPYAVNAAESHRQEEHNFTDVGNVESSGWGGPDLDFEIAEPSAAPAWGNDDFDVPDIKEEEGKSEVNTLTSGISLQQKWARTCQVPGELVAAGAFQAAMQLLTRTAGVVNFAPLKNHILNVYMGGSVSLPLLPHLKPITDAYITRIKTPAQARPHVTITLSQLSVQIKNAYKLTTQGKFADALAIFVNILQSILFLSVFSENEVAEVKDLIKICVEYIACMRLELTRQAEANKGNIARALELGYYMTLCKLQPPHQSLTLRSIIATAYKYKNYITCTSLCKRFLELANQHPQVVQGDAKQVIDKHKKLLVYCQQVFTNDLSLGVELPENSPDIASMLCQRTFTQVSPAVPTARCPFCGSLYHKEYKGTNCDTCLVSQIGLEALGLKVFQN
ncbi:unnamed protein product [Blepharisma stoltei]|uniref:Coatomer subunit alpha n=1 Tax=Blepharisma stoltei TaxID=1481888 RepID=A0AAU9JB09_9CILI|nr:unnamed protein product [Blepharisma stoltei]